jgi:hypothetical protein
MLEAKFRSFFVTHEAVIAQLGERQTEDLKVPGSIPGRGRLILFKVFLISFEEIFNFLFYSFISIQYCCQESEPEWPDKFCSAHQENNTARGSIG